ncbi:hypothetical protein WL00_32470 [Burkholderia cepacia]|nr:hypothetical protein WL00_32470 [Burkholderia cepacia]
MGMAARARVTAQPKTKGDDREVIASFREPAQAARRYFATAGLDAGAAVADAPLDNSGDSMSGVPDESGTLSDDAFSSVGFTSDGGVSCCWSGLGSGGTVGR